MSNEQRHKFVREKSKTPAPLIVNNVIIQNAAIVNSTVVIEAPRDHPQTDSKIKAKAVRKSFSEDASVVIKSPKKSSGNKLSLSDFQLVRGLGHGHFGQVFLVRFSGVKS